METSKAVIELTTKEQAVIDLRRSGATYDRIRKTLGVPESTAFNIVHRYLKAVADRRDLSAAKHLDELIPWNTGYFKHFEGNSAAHIKASLLGNSKQVIVENGKLMLGTWEKIFFCEFDGPRTRKIWIQV